MFETMLAVLLVQAPQVVIPPPPARPVPAPVIVSSSEANGPISTIEVELSGDGRSLWKGPLRVSGSSPASVTHHLQQAAARREPCRAGPRYGSSRDHFAVNLNRYRNPSNPAAVTVTASWTRSVPAAVCGGYEAPSRTVSLTDSVELAPGRSVQLKGDGGLVVTLRALD